MVLSSIGIVGSSVGIVGSSTGVLDSVGTVSSTSVSSGMGSCGFVGQIGVYTGWLNDIAAGTKAAITAMDWIGLVLICFVLPALLSWVFCEILRRISWIKEGDLKLDL